MSVITGTGIVVTTGSGLQTHRDKIARINREVRAMLREGRKPDEIRQELIRQFSFKPIDFRDFDGMLAELKDGPAGTH